MINFNERINYAIMKNCNKINLEDVRMQESRF